MRTRLTAALLALLFATGLIVAAPADAAAAICGSGYTRVAVDSGPYVTLEVYYSTASGGTNCAVTYRTGAAYGVRGYTVASIRKSGGTWVSDAGNYLYYAGPKKVTSTNGKCIDAQGTVDYRGITYLTVLTHVACG